MPVILSLQMVLVIDRSTIAWPNCAERGEEKGAIGEWYVSYCQRINCSGYNRFQIKLHKNEI